MAKMKNDELISLVTAASSDAVQYSGEFNADSENLLKAYEGLPLPGQEVEEGQSSLISTDVFDTVEADMPSHVRTFLGSNHIIKFKANNPKDPEQVKEAEQKTEYINWLIRHQEDSFATLHGWMKDAEIQKISVLKYFPEDTMTTVEEKFTGVSEFELIAIEESLNGEDVEKIDITETTEPDEQGEFDVTFRVTRGKQSVKIEKIRSDNFRISRFATSLNEAELTGDDEIVTRGELLSQGYSKDLINQIPRISNEQSTNRQSNLKNITFHDEDGKADTSDGNEITDWASEEVEIQNRYVKIDFDGDGVAERRYIKLGGRILLENKPYDHVPYAALSAILMPDSLIGRSRAQSSIETQMGKTAMLRGAANNTYMHNNPRILANERVNIDELNDVVLNGVIQVEGDTPITGDVQPLQIPFVADKTILLMNYLDQQQVRRTGALATSQGLNSDDLNQETATRFNGVQQEGAAKTELVARVFAETGFKKLYEGVAWTVMHFQDSETEIEVLGEPLTIDPTKWKFTQSAISQVGLAISDNEDSLRTLATILQDQNELAAVGSALVDEKKRYNTRQRIIQATGLGDMRDFYNDPEVPEETLLAENELLRNAVQQLQAQAQSNPLAEAQTIEAQKDLLVEQNRAQEQLRKDQLKAQQDTIQNDQNQQKIDLDAQEQRFNQILEFNENQARVNKMLIDGFKQLKEVLGADGVISPNTVGAMENQGQAVIESQEDLKE